MTESGNIYLIMDYSGEYKFRGFFWRGEAIGYIRDIYGKPEKIAESWLDAVDRSDDYHVQFHCPGTFLKIGLRACDEDEWPIVSKLLEGSRTRDPEGFPSWVEEKPGTRIDRTHYIREIGNHVYVRYDEVEADVARGVLAMPLGGDIAEFDYYDNKDGSKSIESRGRGPVTIKISDGYGAEMLKQLASRAETLAYNGIAGLSAEISAR